MGTPAENFERMQKSFILPRLGQLQGLAQWPNAQVPVMAQVNEFIPEICKVPYDYLYRDDPAAMAECTLLTWEYTGLALMILELDSYNFEAESAGAKINFYPDHIPDVDRNDFFIKDEDDFDKIRFNGMESGRLPYLVDYFKRYNELCGLESFPSFCAPWSLAANLYGFENLVVSAMTEPEFVHELLRRIVDDLSVPMVQALAEVIPGAKSIGCADAWASPPMATMDIIEEFVEPYLKRLGEKAGLPITSGGVWGVSTLQEADRERFADFIGRIVGGLQFFDPDVEKLTPEYFRAFADQRGQELTLGLSTGFLQSASVDQVVDRVKHYCLVGKRGKTPFTFFISNLAPRTPVENLKAAVTAVQIYGAPDATEETPFVMPEVESFEDFLRRKMANNAEGYDFHWLSRSGYAHLMK